MHFELYGWAVEEFESLCSPGGLGWYYWSCLVLGLGPRLGTGNWELGSAGVVCFQINPQTYEMLQLFLKCLTELWLE